MDFITSLNSTSILSAALPHTTDTYWNTLQEISSYNVHLNVFERMWVAWYAWMGNDVLATGIMSFMMHELVYFGRSLPWIIIDSIPAFNKYKIQGVRAVLSRFFLNWIMTSDLFYSKKFPLLLNNGTVPNSS